MRIDPRSVSNHSRGGWGSASDAPTFLPQDEVVLPLKAPKSDSVITSAPKTKKKDPLPQARVVQHRGASQSTIKPPKQESVAAQAPARPAPQARHTPPSGTSASAAQRTPSGQTASAPRPSSPSIGTPPSGMSAQQTPVPPQGAIPPFVQFEGGASFEPLAIPLPPELAPPVYGWLRRLALQADLAGADRLLREALADLTSALNALIIYASPEGLHTVGINDEMPKDTQPIIAVAKSRRALVGTHSALIPITTTTETIAVIQLIRNVRQPAFNMVDYVMMAAISRESASIMHHLVVEHLQRRNELEADKKSLYRPEALEQHRRRGQEGVVTELSPGWVKATYKVLLGALTVAIVAAFVIHVPTYSEGPGVVVLPGSPITAGAPGTVDDIFVQTGMLVKKGNALVKLKSEKEESAYRQAKSELDTALQSYLFDPSDEQVRKTLSSAQAAAKRAEDEVEQRTVRASADGTVSDIRVGIGKSVNFGDPICTIVAPGTQPELWAFLPGSDIARLKDGQELQIELSGYQKTREKGTIYSITKGVSGSAMARQMLGPELADALKLAQDGSYVLVKAKIGKNTFRAKGKKYFFHHGMPAKNEVRVEDKRFITTLLPSLEKYTE
jgi:biotin carboxyl carrier protein